MKSKTPEQIAEIARLKKELKDVKRLLADEILDHRIDIATLEVASEIYHFDPVALKKKERWYEIAHRVTETGVNGDESTKLKVRPVCSRLGYSRQAYYRERTERRREAVNEALIVDAVVRARIVHPRCGTRKLLKYTKDDLERAGLSVGRDRFFEIMRTHDMLVKRRKAFVPHTTHWDASLPVSRNLLANRIVDGPNQAFVADITYIRTAEGFLYLSLVTDYFSKDIVGWHLADDLTAEGCLKALEVACRIIPPGATVIHHSDRGCQYASRAYREKLDALGMLSSMTEELHCYENSVAERVNGILKGEYGLDVEFESSDLALKAVSHVIDVYNNLRIHESLGYVTPARARREPEFVRDRIVAIQKAAQVRRKDYAEKKAAALAAARKAA